MTVVTGFLGAGKSTLVREWVGGMQRAEVAVIVNELGEVGIDGELLAAHVARLREIAGGCVCCSRQAELVSALFELSESRPRPGRILVEASGAASPAGVIRAMGAGRGAGGGLRLDGVIAVVDATRAREVLGFDLAVEQLGFADVVVLSHADRVAAPESGGGLDAVEARVRRHAPAAVVARAANGVASLGFDELLAGRAEALYLPAERSGHTAFEAVSLLLEGELDEDRFADWVESALADVEARLLRVKGILAMAGLDRRVILQGVGESVTVELGRPWGDAPPTSRLVVLGLGLDGAALEAGFLACQSTVSSDTVG